ncbi:MAG: hypothetical protein KAT31_03250 [Bacteroidales bacterium]|nr:hypothetical protein [Bacteroidales bacterium]
MMKLYLHEFYSIAVNGKYITEHQKKTNPEKADSVYRNTDFSAVDGNFCSDYNYLEKINLCIKSGPEEFNNPKQTSRIRFRLIG